MTKLLFVSLLLFIFQIFVNGKTCKTHFNNLAFRTLGLSDLLGAHNEDRELLGSWLVFFFNHFKNSENLVKYLERFDIAKLPDGNFHCFRRAITIFLLHSWAGDLSKILQVDNFESYFENKLQSVNALVSKEFLDLVGSGRINSHLKNLLIKIEPRKAYERNTFTLIDTLKKFRNKNGTFKIDHNKIEDLFFKGVNSYNQFVKETQKNMPLPDNILKQDYDLLAYLHTKPFYFPVDLTERKKDSIFSKVFTKRARWYKRSSTFKMNIQYNEPTVFDMCDFSDKGNVPNLDDLNMSFFTILKWKMTLGHARFVSEFNKALFNKSYKIEGLKGLRRLWQLVRRRSLTNFFKMYYDLISRELLFMANDMETLFKSSTDCEFYNLGNNAGENYLRLRGIIY